MVPSSLTAVIDDEDIMKSTNYLGTDEEIEKAVLLIREDPVWAEHVKVCTDYKNPGSPLEKVATMDRRILEVPKYICMDRTLPIVIRHIRRENLSNEGSFKMAQNVMIEIDNTQEQIFK